MYLRLYNIHLREFTAKKREASKKQRIIYSFLIHPLHKQAQDQSDFKNLSASEAIGAVHIIDTTIWKETRYLPLELDKMYTKSKEKFKKLLMQDSQFLNNQVQVTLTQPTQIQNLTNLLE